MLAIIKPIYYLFKVITNIPYQVKARKVARLHRRKERMELELELELELGIEWTE